MLPNPQEAVDFVTFTEEILSGKLHFLPYENTERYFKCCANLFKANISQEYQMAAFLYFLHSVEHKRYCHCINYPNFTQCQGAEIFRQFARNSAICGNCAFQLNFHTRKLGEILVIYTVHFEVFCFSLSACSIRQLTTTATLKMEQL